MCPRTDGLKDRDRLIVACRIPSADDDPKFEVSSNNTSFIIHRHCQTVGGTPSSAPPAPRSVTFFSQLESNRAHCTPRCHSATNAENACIQSSPRRKERKTSNGKPISPHATIPRRLHGGGLFCGLASWNSYRPRRPHRISFSIVNKRGEKRQ